MNQLRDYQIKIANKANEILNKYKIVYLSCEVRTGKTLMALETAKLFGANKVLFITKKKAITSILNDYNNFGYTFLLTVINNESLHTINDSFDIIISDEHHRNGAFPKANICTKLIKQKYSKLPMIFLSGTMSPESYSQIFHQFWISDYSPFKEYINFYKWAKDYVTVKKKYLGYAEVNDYSDANNSLIKNKIDKYILTLTQEEAGFTTSVKENILYVDMLPVTYKIANRLKKDNIFIGHNDTILADTGAKLMSKLHQLYSGTCILESGKSIIIDNSKLLFINEKFKNNKIAIFYKFQAEKDMIEEFYKDNICFDLETFNSTNKNIACQLVSFREGISLKNADYLVYLNIDYSAVTYWQSRDRMTTMQRKENEIFWIFSKVGIEKNIYNAVMNKKNYTLSIFKKDVKISK